MDYQVIPMPDRGMNRRLPAVKLPAGYWPTVINADILPGSFSRRKGSSQLHTPGSGGVPAGCTLWDFLELHEEELTQDKMLLLLEDSGGATELWAKSRADGGSYGDFAQVTWTGVLAAWSDNLLGTVYPYPEIIRVPLSARIIPVDINADAQVLYYREYDAPYGIFDRTQQPRSIIAADDGELFTEARLLEPRHIPRAEIRILPQNYTGTQGNLGPYEAYFYGYTLVYDDGQEGLPWGRDSRNKIPDDIYLHSDGWPGLGGFHNDDDGTIELQITVNAIVAATTTDIPLRVVGMNIWRSKMTGFGAASGVEQVHSDFRLLGFASFGKKDAIGDYYETDVSFANVTPSNPSGFLKRFDVGVNLTSGSTRWSSDGALSPVNAALRITAVAGDEDHALVGDVFRIEAQGSPSDQDIDVYDPEAVLSTGTAYSGEIVEGILAYGSDGDYHAQILDNQNDLSFNPEMWSYLGVTTGEFSIAAIGKVGVLAHGRLFLFNCYIEDEYFPARMAPSLRGRYDTFASAEMLDFDWDGGEAVKGAAFTGTGLLVFKERQVGDFRVGEDQLGMVFSDREFKKDDGLCSKRTIVDAENRVFFAGWEGIYEFTDGKGFRRISQGIQARDATGKTVYLGGVEEIYDLMDDDDLRLATGGWDPEKRKYVLCVPIVNGSVTWDDITDPIPAPVNLDDNYVTFEWAVDDQAWNLSDRAVRGSEPGVDGEWFTTDLTDIDQQLAAFGSEQETNIHLYAESFHMGGAVVKLTKVKTRYEGGPLLIKSYSKQGRAGPVVALSDTIKGEQEVQRRLGTGGNPVWLVIESESELSVKELAAAGSQLDKVLNR